MYELPTALVIDGENIPITNKGDFRMVLDCFEAINDVEIAEEERIISALIIFYDDLNSLEDLYAIENIQERIDKMFDFFNCNQKESGKQMNYKLLDWKEDEMLIISAVNKVAGQEVRALDYVHWYTFMSWYMGIGNSALQTVVGIRDKIVNGKKLDDFEKDYRNSNPEYFTWDALTVKQKEEDELIKSIWNSDK